MRAMPLSGDASAIGHIAIAPPPETPVTIAMSAQAGEAASASAPAAFPLLFPPQILSPLLIALRGLVLIMACPPGAPLVAPQRRPVEPLIHPPEPIKPSGIGGIGVMNGIVLHGKRA